MKKILAAAFATSACLTVPAMAQTVPDGSFESPNVQPSGYVYNPTGVAGVTFTGGSGVQANGSAWVFADAPDGSQTGFLQNTSNITFDLSGLTAGESYVVDFFGAARNSPNYLPNPFNVVANGSRIGAYTISSTAWSPYTSQFAFVATGAADTLSFIGTAIDGDHDVGIDAVSLAASGETPVGSLGAVPEPATWAMMLLGFGMVGFGLRYRRKRATVSFA